MLCMCVLAFLLLVQTVASQTTQLPEDDSFTNMSHTNVTTPQPITEFSLNVTHLQSTISTISFKWKALVPLWMQVQSYDIWAAKLHSDSEAVMTYPPIPGYEDYFEALDLVKDSTWNVCISATVVNKTEVQAEAETIDTCFESFTIPYVRNDSLLILFIVVGYILLMVLIGYVSWRCAVNKQEKEREASETSTDDNTEGKNKYANKPEEQKPILLSSPSDDQPRSSIEDEDIPYITPPWSEIEREENAKHANSFTHA